MKFFIDSAKIDEIVYAYENWAFAGCTTNPNHILKSGKPFKEVVTNLADHFKGKDFSISIEVDPYLETAEDMVAAAEEYAAISENFTIKIPCTEQGLVAIKRLTEEGIKTNCTLVFSPSQAIQAARAGAKYVSPFIGWKEASGENTTQFVSSVVEIYKNFNFNTEIIVAAIRNGKQIADAALLGADITTAGFEVYKSAFYHPFTDFGLERFQKAWDQVEK
jgi:transaldolase